MQQSILMNQSNVQFENIKVKKKAEGRNRYSQVHVPHLTRDTRWENDKSIRKQHIQENQEVSPYPAGDHNAARNRYKGKLET